MTTAADHPLLTAIVALATAAPVVNATTAAMSGWAGRRRTPRRLPFSTGVVHALEVPPTPARSRTPPENWQSEDVRRRYWSTLRGVLAGLAVLYTVGTVTGLLVAAGPGRVLALLPTVVLAAYAVVLVRQFRRIGSRAWVRQQALQQKAVLSVRGDMQGVFEKTLSGVTAAGVRLVNVDAGRGTLNGVLGQARPVQVRITESESCLDIHVCVQASSVTAVDSLAKLNARLYALVEAVLVEMADVQPRTADTARPVHSSNRWWDRDGARQR